MLLNVFFSVTYIILLHVHYSLNLLVTNQVFVVGVTTEGTMERMLLQSQSSMFLISIFFIDNLTKKIKDADNQKIMNIGPDNQPE